MLEKTQELLKPILEGQDEETPPENKGKMLVDATVIDQSIHYPTDLNLLNEAREISEGLIDELYKQSDYAQKPRTYRRIARKSYLNLAKKETQLENTAKGTS